MSDGATANSIAVVDSYHSHVSALALFRSSYPVLASVKYLVIERIYTARAYPYSPDVRLARGLHNLRHLSSATSSPSHNRVQIFVGEDWTSQTGREIEMASDMISGPRGLLIGLTLLTVLSLVNGCGQDVQLNYSPPVPEVSVAPALVSPGLSETALAGRDLFDNNCARCHGDEASGTDLGPPLVHIYYEPNHHPDTSFRSAVWNGVPEHHWSFGDMPPVPGLSPEEVEEIIWYVRETQRAGGIFRGTGGSTVC